MQRSTAQVDMFFNLPSRKTIKQVQLFPAKPCFFLLVMTHDVLIDKLNCLSTYF